MPPLTSIRPLLICLAGLSALSACQPSAEQQAPAIPPTELGAVNTPPPDYPAELACAGIGGTATLLVAVGPGTRPSEVSVSRSSGQAALDEAAVKAVRDWEFQPATRNGQPVAQKIQVPVNFRPPQERPAECFKLDEKK